LFDCFDSSSITHFSPTINEISLFPQRLSIDNQTKDNTDGQSIKLDLIGLLNVGDTVHRGGVIIEPDNIVRLYGNVHHSYALLKSIPVNKFTRMQFVFTETEIVLGAGFCLFRDFGSSSIGSTTYCIVLRGGKFSHQPGFVIVDSGSAELDGDPLNLALRRPTSQSSVTGQTSIEEPGDSEFAVDGNTNQVFNIEAWQYNTVTRTEPEIRPWWELDLEGDRSIRQIVIYKRMDVYEDDLKDFTISIFDSDGISTAVETYSGTASTISSFEFDGVIGNRIKIILNGNSPRVLCLAEVQVYGTEFQFDIPIGQLFYLPEMSFNRLAFIQDRSESVARNVDLDYESSLFKSISISEGDQSDLVSVEGYDSIVVHSFVYPFVDAV